MSYLIPQFFSDAVMPIVDVDQEGYRIEPRFGFLADLQRSALVVTKERPLQIGKVLVPQFNPFWDHLTSLIRKDEKVHKRITRMWVLHIHEKAISQNLSIAPYWLRG